MKIARPPKNLEDRVKHIDSILQSESTRGRVNIAAEVLNVTLAEILMRHFVASGDFEQIDKDELLGVNRPLSAFSSRIAACYRLGLVSETDRKALDYLRQIRNVAAHECSDLLFEEQKLGDCLGQFVKMVCQDALAALQMTAVGPCPQSCEEWFTSCCGFLLFKLTDLRDNLQPAVTQFKQVAFDEEARNSQPHEG